MRARESALERGLGRLGYLLHNAFRRRLRARPPVLPQVRSPAQTAIPGLRYRLRRDGFSAPLIAECFALYGTPVPDDALAAARRLLEGGIVELADAAARRHALALAALARAIAGERVHLLTAGEATAQSLAEWLTPVFAPLGIKVGCLTREARGPTRRELYASPLLCAAHREIALDYLREGVRFGERRGALRARLERVGARGAPAPLGELQSALVADAELVLLDDAQAPIVITAQLDASRERLMYEQALELARTLAPETDFTVEEAAIRLTPSASLRLERLVAPLGGLWSARSRREELVALALEALHFVQQGSDYRVEGGRVVFPPPAPDAEEPGPDELELRKLVEVKEGARLSSRPDVLARLSVPAFFARYSSLAGVCADASGLEAEFWTLYSLKTSRAGSPPASLMPACRVFLTAAAKRAALLERARQGGALFAVRSRAEAQALQEVLKTAQIEATLIALPGLQPPAQQAGPAELVVAELPLAARHVAHAAQAHLAHSVSLLLSLEDEAVARALGHAWAAAARLAAQGRDELPPRWAGWIARRAQRALERSQRMVRRELKARDRLLEDLLAVSGPGE